MAWAARSYNIVHLPNTEIIQGIEDYNPHDMICGIARAWSHRVKRHKNYTEKHNLERTRGYGTDEVPLGSEIAWNAHSLEVLFLPLVERADETD